MADDGRPARLHVEYSPPIYNASRELHQPQYHGEAAIDIVFVQGLASDYERTWSIERPDGTRYHWLREKLKEDMPDARVLAFEYPSRWYENPTHTTLSECGGMLMRSLLMDRRHAAGVQTCPTRRRRPILLVGHSFGGLVIKQVTILHASRTYRSIQRSRKTGNCF
jgi:triacylglycerol esterase/lipase EstA (alpha/beta hydrolase family)